MLEQTLAKYFHFSDFRPGQKEIVESIVAGNDVVALMPTGGGKSLCYQVPPLLTGHIGI
ncbi:MAG: DEAD/DEAH box helicase, partial [Patescibacteria group bacterium]